MKKYYLKVLLTKGRIPPVGIGAWPKPGIWTEPIKGPLAACENGYHVTTLSKLVDTLDDVCYGGFKYSIWLVETSKIFRRRSATDIKLLCRKACLVEELCDFKGWEWFERDKPLYLKRKEAIMKKVSKYRKRIVP